MTYIKKAESEKMTDQDKEILQRLKSPIKREAAYRELLKTYGPRLYWHIRRIVVSHDDAEDVMQDTAIKIFNGIETFRGESSLLTWLYRIATNESLAHLRRRCTLFQSVDSLGESLAEKVESEADIDAERATVLFQQAVAKLPTQQRLAFNMRYYDELSYSQMSEITGKNINTLKTNYHFAAESVKKYIKENAI